MRFLLFLVLTIAALLPGGGAHADDQLNGRYYGIDDATGASIVIAPDPGGYTGTFYDPQGRSQDFQADAVGDAAEAVLDMDGRTVLLRMAPLPYGAQVSLVPFNADGNLVIEASRSLAFLREGVRLPEMPEQFLPAPRANCQRVAAYSFMVSYEFWEPAGVMNGYLCLPERARTLMRFFPALQLDVVWKICLAPGNEVALSRALRQTGLSCPEVIDGIANIQRSGQFNRYKAEVKGERETMTLSMRCAEGYPETKANCERAARLMKEAAVSLRTPTMVLQEYR